MYFFIFSTVFPLSLSKGMNPSVKVELSASRVMV